MLNAGGGKLPDNPLLTSDYLQRFLSAVGVLVPAAAVALLPQSVFRPPGRSATVAAMLVVAAAWAFYGAALGVPFYVVSGALTTVNPNLGVGVFMLLSIPVSAVVIGLTIYFWFRIALSELCLGGAQAAGIGLIALTAVAAVSGIGVLLGQSTVS